MSETRYQFVRKFIRQFVMLDDENLDKAAQFACQTWEDGPKQALVIRGAAGTGKSQLVKVLSKVCHPWTTRFEDGDDLSAYPCGRKTLNLVKTVRPGRSLQFEAGMRVSEIVMLEIEFEKVDVPIILYF